MSRVPGSAWDSRSGAYRAPAFLYKDIRSYVDSSGFPCKDDVLDLVPSPALTMRTVLRDYQERAVQAWDRAGAWGVVVLPTGSGKTHVAMKAISLAGPAIVIVPTLDLLAQWKERLDDEFGIDSGKIDSLGDGENPAILGGTEFFHQLSLDRLDVPVADQGQLGRCRDRC